MERLPASTALALFLRRDCPEVRHLHYFYYPDNLGYTDTRESASAQHCLDNRGRTVLYIVIDHDCAAFWFVIGAPYWNNFWSRDFCKTTPSEKKTWQYITHAVSGQRQDSSTANRTAHRNKLMLLTYQPTWFQDNNITFHLEHSF